ncbi:MAG: SUF system NifU family Fe-S cluster assembly protein [Treponemataceae bacterium]|nr:SUF system NifU family Fe-S cluster assembly protein [Treponemataceae bacterium]
MTESPLYEEIIRSHYKRPLKRKTLEGLPYVENPSCGDKVRIALSINDGGIIEAAAFDGSGCSISMSSADILAQLLEGKSREEACGLIKTFLAVLRGEAPLEALQSLGDAIAFSGVVRLPVRVKCAALAWRAALEQLENSPSNT